MSSGIEAHLQELARRVGERTAQSRRIARADGALANAARPRFGLATEPAWHPLVASRGSGARFSDVDGNEYVDVLMAFGVALFGHAPAFVSDAIRRQLDRSLVVGPQREHSFELATRLCAILGTDRAVILSTGTEAVLAAVRLARCATFRRRIAYFRGSYHGHADPFCFEAGPGGALPKFLGVSDSTAADVLVLDWRHPDSLQRLAEAAPDLAAVLVEPIRPTRPEDLPVDFLRSVADIARDAGTALVFDEIVTGFRVGLRGAKSLCGIEPDLAVYGKVLGGGLPIGVVAGRARFLDAADGGPCIEAGAMPHGPTTFVAGTYNKHPLSVAAAHAVLDELDRRGPLLHDELARLTTSLVDRVRLALSEGGAPLSCISSSSMFALDPAPEAHPALLEAVRLHLLLRGIHSRDGGGFWSTAHGPAEADGYVDALRDSLRELRAAGAW